MKFGKVFNYVCKLNSGERVVWRVLAEGRVEADAKVNAYLEECAKCGYFSVPVAVDFANREDNLVLY